ncbi:MAG: hypothetical protein V4757_04085 [Pseudomonadota bacterium]
MKVSNIALCLSAGLMLSACGGGGSGGSTAPTLVSVPLTTANYDPTGRAAAATLIDASSSASSAGSIASVPGTNDPLPTAGFLRVAEYAARHALAALPAREQAAETITDSENCDFGGSLSVTVNDNNNNNRLDAGDTASFNFQSCKVRLDEPSINGGLDFAFQSVTLNGYGDPVAYTATITARQLVSGGSALDGAADYNVTTTRATVNFRNTVSTRNGLATVYNFLATFDASGVNETLTVAGEIGIKGASYTVSTPAPIAMGNFYPAAGVLRVADSAGGRVDVIMGATTFTLDLYLPGDTVRDATATYTWAALAAGTI